MSIEIFKVTITIGRETDKADQLLYIYLLSRFELYLIFQNIHAAISVSGCSFPGLASLEIFKASARVRHEKRVTPADFETLPLNAYTQRLQDFSKMEN